MSDDVHEFQIPLNIKFSKKLTCPGIELGSLAQQSGMLTSHYTKMSFVLLRL